MSKSNEFRLVENLVGSDKGTLEKSNECGQKALGNGRTKCWGSERGGEGIEKSVKVLVSTSSFSITFGCTIASLQLIEPPTTFPFRFFTDIIRVLY